MITISTSILNSIKKNLGLDENYNAFDLDILMHINSVFSILEQLGVGPEGGFSIQDDTAVWDDFIDSDDRLNIVKTYMSLKVRLIFDPPSTSFAIESFQKQIDQYEWRLNVTAEGNSWTPPTTV